MTKSLTLEYLNKYLNDVEGDATGVVREDYTHYSKVGMNITKVRSPEDPQKGITISTSKVGQKIIGNTTEAGIAHYSRPSLNIHLQGKLGDVKAYWNAKAQGERPLPSWLDRALQDHLRYFYK